MEISTFVNSITDTIPSNNEDMRDDIISSLGIIDQKILGGHLTKSDVHSIASKMNRDVYTVRRYIRGDVKNLDLAVKLLNICNAYLAINADAADRKSKIEF
jgi:hypothetical protein